MREWIRSMVVYAFWAFHAGAREGQDSQSAALMQCTKAISSLSRACIDIRLSFVADLVLGVTLAVVRAAMRDGTVARCRVSRNA